MRAPEQRKAGLSGFFRGRNASSVFSFSFFVFSFVFFHLLVSSVVSGSFSYEVSKTLVIT